MPVRFSHCQSWREIVLVTEVSGRGVGMDAVKSFVEREEGTIELVFRSSDTDSSYRAFDTVISMPGKFAVQAMG